jgi:hypothetical protein
MLLGASPFPRNTGCSSLVACGGVQRGLARLRSVLAENSRVVAPLRVATTCYIKVQRTLLSCRVSGPKGSRDAALECLATRQAGRLLL